MAKVSSGSKKERFGFIESYGSSLGVRYLCNRLNVSPAGFYKWRGRKVSKRIIDDRKLLQKIEKIFFDNKTNYGSPRVHAALREDGERVNRKRVERLMRESGLVGKAGRIYRRKALPEKFYTKMPNLKKDMRAPTNINEQWVGDLTYLKVAGEWRYLAVVMDLYSRRILGWSLGQNKTAELTKSALEKAIKHRDIKRGLIFHTDRGSEYGAYLIQDALKVAGIKSSMNRPKYVTDNANMESFFQSMKTECIHEVSFKTESELRMALCEYLDNYYNSKRIHSSIGYTSPIKYERMAA